MTILRKDDELKWRLKKNPDHISMRVKVHLYLLNTIVVAMFLVFGRFQQNMDIHPKNVK